MGAVKRMIEDFADLRTCHIQDREERWRRTDIEFQMICNNKDNGAFSEFLKVLKITKRIQTTTGERRLRWATKLWNAIDSLTSPEVLWRLMLRELPDVFYAPEVNAMRFTY